MNQENSRKQKQRKKIQSILKLNCSPRIKIAMLNSKILQLSQMVQLQKFKVQQVNRYQNMSTSFTDDLSNFTFYETSIQELEEKIIQKRIIKFQNNQQIENCQDSLLELEEIVQASMNYDHKLRKHIDQLVKQENQRFQQNKQNQQQDYINKSFQAVSHLFKGWFS